MRLESLGFLFLLFLKTLAGNFFSKILLLKRYKR